MLAVPILAGVQIVGVLAARMVTRAVKRTWIEQQLAPQLKAAAAAIIAAEISERAVAIADLQPVTLVRSSESPHVQ